MASAMVERARQAEEALNILLVEDNPVDARMVQIALSECENFPFRFLHQLSFRESKQAIKEQSFHVVLLDLSLPDENGLDTVVRMQADAPQLPIIVLTGLDDEDLAVRAVGAGAQDYLVKGRFDGRALAQSIRYAIERHRLKRQLYALTDQLKQANAHLEILSQIDPLTEMLNRRGLQEAFARLSALPPGKGRHLLALMLDLDDFKRVNDSFGHAVGDAVLKESSRRIRASLRPGDVAARIGGDEFLVLLPDTSLEEGTRLGERMRSFLSALPVLLPNDLVRVTASLGLLVVRVGTTEIQELLGMTRNPLYRSKTGGKNRLSCEWSGGGDSTPDPAPFTGFLSDLRSGRRLYAVSRPLVRLADNGEAGLEFLPRTDIPFFELPEHFFGICADAGILGEVDRRCLELCLKEAAGLPPAERRLHFSLFPSTLLQARPAELLALFPASVPRKACFLGISLRALLEDRALLRERMRLLKGEGLRFAVQDVGFGRTCLEALAALEPDMVKLSARCLRGAGEDAEKRRELVMLVHMAMCLGAEITADGVEDARQAQLLRDLGVPLAQGPLWEHAS